MSCNQRTEVKFEVVEKEDKRLEAWLQEIFEKEGIKAIILFGGERWLCVSQVMVALVENEIVGIATIASRGEIGQGYPHGHPTIIGIYVLPRWRKQGIGTKLLKETIDWMIQNNFFPVQIDILNPIVKKIIEKIPPEKKEKIHAVEYGNEAMKIFTEN